MAVKAGALRRFLDWLDSGYRTPEDLLLDCREKINQQEGEVQAWVEVSPQPALSDGPLSGIPFAAKDIFETRGLATEYGSPIYKGRKGDRDAALVTRLRTLGAVLVGKTHTTAFAYFDPAPTRNPRHPAHTPGGSSSGSAAAVAASMVPLALGTQTLGSMIRPASYCGVVGFKPSYGLLPLDGVLPFAPSFDTAGFFTETADDMKLLWERLGYPAGADRVHRLGVPPLPSVVESPMVEAFRDSMARLRAEGFEVEEIELPEEFSDLDDAARLVVAYEGARTHEQRFREFGERIGAKLAELVRRGLETSEQQYQEARGLLAEAEGQMIDVFADTPVLATPAAPGPAPAGLESTGNPVMNGVWTGMGLPAITVPMTLALGLPLGLQLVTAGSNGALLETALAIEARL